MRVWSMISLLLLAGCATNPAMSARDAVLMRTALRCMSAVNQHLSVTGVLAGGRTDLEGSRAVSVWRNVPTATGTKNNVRCEADPASAEVLSLQADGVELLNRPQS